jgi:hypothetical protein
MPSSHSKLERGFACRARRFRPRRARNNKSLKRIGFDVYAAVESFRELSTDRGLAGSLSA